MNFSIPLAPWNTKDNLLRDIIKNEKEETYYDHPRSRKKYTRNLETF